MSSKTSSDLSIDKTDELDKGNSLDNTGKQVDGDNILEDTDEQVDDHYILEDTDGQLDESNVLVDTPEQIEEYDILEYVDEIIGDHNVQQDSDGQVDDLNTLEDTDEQYDDNILENTDEQVDDHNTLDYTDEQIDRDYTIDNTDQTEVDIPSVYVDKDLLPSSGNSFTVNNDVQPFGCGSEFLSDEIVFKEILEIEQYKKFELYANYNKMDEHSDHSGPSANDDTPLELYIQTAPNGMIINDNVYLTNLQWNTLVYISDSTLSCAVCGAYCDEKHILLDSHKANLELCQPLAKYDISITRKIDSFYHCAVCNLIFHQSQIDDHFSGKEHENNILFAINKVSDIMYDFSIHRENNEIKKDTYHYNARAINNDSIDSESDDECVNNYIAGSVNSEDDTDEDDEHFYDNVEPPLNLACSYASMARKPKDELPAVLEIDLGNKMVKVRFDSWNMVISPKNNMFYCMVCTQYDHVRRKSKHCKSEEHIKKLEQCKVVEQYEKHLVRQVDDKLYHCGHCNNLQLINEMEDHIESQHPPTKSTSHLDSPVKKRPNANHDLINATKTTNVATNETDKMAKDKNKNIQEPKMADAMNLNMYHELRAANSNLSEDIVICTFGKSVRIAKLAYNIVCGRANEFYCGLCEVSINKEGLARHVHDFQHLILLQGTPFIEAFNINLYRQIRDALHCALCNELIPLIPEIIISHKLDPKHIFSLGKALGQIRNVSAIEAQIRNEKKNSEAFKDAKAVEAKTVAPLVTDALNNAVTNKFGTPVKDDKKITPVATIKDGKFDSYIQEIAPTSKIESTEFIEVKNGLKDELDLQSDQSEEDDSMADAELDFEEYLYVKINNCYVKITNSSFNTLVEVGDGSKYCFVCSVVVNDEFKKHVESRGHAENMDRYKFVDKYKEDLLRQIYLMYHCSICNVLITRKQVNHHLSWPTHVLQMENSKLNSKQRKSDIKAGTKQVAVNTQKENIYLNETETKIKIILNISIQKENVVSVTRKNKIIIFNDNVLKISFDAWHSLSPLENRWKCKMCQTEFEGAEFANHVTSEWHTGNLNKFEKQYSPALIRKINDSTLNCIMCNTELSHKHHIVKEHVQGKKHVKNYDNILKESSVANSYADCDEDVLTL